jgi:hypothetical protein
MTSENILKIYRLATPEEKRDGVVWYAEAYAQCNRIIGAFTNGDDIDDVKVSTYHTMKRKAWSILEAMPDHEGVIAILNGQKIVSFYRNIMGDDTCTVDGHAKNIYYGERHSLTDDKTNVGKKEYKTISDAYVDAGKRARVNGRPLKAFEIQAITWVVWRRVHNIK